MRSVVLWSNKGYCCAISCRNEDQYNEKAEMIKTEEGYFSVLTDAKAIFDLIEEPILIVSKANFGEQDVYWHDSDISVMAINAAIRVIIETGGVSLEDLSGLLSSKYFTMIRGTRGAATPARAEYQNIYNAVLAERLADAEIHS